MHEQDVLWIVKVKDHETHASSPFDAASYPFECAHSTTGEERAESVRGSVCVHLIEIFWTKLWSHECTLRPEHLRKANGLELEATKKPIKHVHSGAGQQGKEGKLFNYQHLRTKLTYRSWSTNAPPAAIIANYSYDLSNEP